MLLPLVGTTIGLPIEQQPLKDIVLDDLLTVVAELKKAEIIPTVIEAFLPTLTVSISWSKKHSAALGNTIKPSHLQNQPSITLHGDGNTYNEHLKYIVTLTDPDAPSRVDPKWSQMCHWIASNISLSSPSLDFVQILPIPNTHNEEKWESLSIDEIIPYKPPGPPPKTGKHRYVFLVFAPRNGTTEPLDLSKPGERRHWGTGKEGGGVREWAGDNGLVAVGANFVYAQNKKQ
ncbi:PEBP-like protein [Amniculicola lignicola CBS 123094]|uniref:PEBP-like protein n=1 Tax=Amniculicola lignicola CBS 123094 TaxID=1392246 RepID=A0A6A5W867_9PLEO|nr:PEBP-like protein [Amniculicola lignicola CBS 123094]